MNYKKLALVLGLAGFSLSVHAAFPEKAVTLVVPFSAGGPSDKITRDIAEALREPLGQTVIVEKITGAGRSEEHTSELQSLMRSSYAVFCLKKKKKHRAPISHRPWNPHSH